MKKFLYALICVLTIFTSGIVLSGCSLEGKSAYEIAVEHGFKGTEAEWLASLKGDTGENGKDGKDGYNGLNGKDGEDGKDLTALELFNLGVEFGLYTNDAAGLQQFLSYYFSSVQDSSVDVVKNVAAKCLNQVVSIFTQDELGDNEVGAGSGVFYKIDKANKEAFIITNYHVVSAEVQDNLQGTIYTESAVIKVYLYGTEDISGSNILGYDFGSNALTAQYIGGSANYDLAVVKISGEDFDKALTLNPYIEEISFADSNNLQLGETAIAIGNAMGKGIGVTKGVVSINNEDINPFISGSTRKLTCIRTDAAVNGGNSGGGLFDGSGNLIGIVNARKVSHLDQNSIVAYENIGYALPSSYVKNVVENIIDFYQVKYQEENEDNIVGVFKPIIGITITVANPNDTYIENENTHILSENVVVVSVAEDSRAEEIGVKVDDIVAKIKVKRGEETIIQEITRMDILMNYSLTFRYGDEITYVVNRYNAEEEVWQEIELNSFVIGEDDFVEYKGAAV